MTDKLSDLFYDYKSEVFRLQTLTEYNVDEEKKDYQIFKRNNLSSDFDFYKDWNENIKKQTHAGKRFINTNLVLDDGPTTYQKFIFPIMKSQQNSGAEWLFMKKSDFDIIVNKYFSDPFDYLLFDDKTAFQMVYNKSGEWLKSVEISDKEIINKLVDLKQEFIKNSYDFNEYKKRWF